MSTGPPSSPARAAGSARRPPAGWPREGFRRRLRRPPRATGSTALAARDRRHGGAPATSPTPTSVAALAAAVGGSCDVLVNNAGGAFGADPVAEADADDWQRDVRGQRARRAAGDPGAAARAAWPAAPGTSSSWARPPGGSPTRAAAATPRPSTAPQALAETLRLELIGQPVRVTRSRPAWCAPTSSRSTASAATRSGPTRSTPASPSRWSPTTSPTAIAWVRHPAAARQHRPAGGPARSPRPPSTRCTHRNSLLEQDRRAVVAVAGSDPAQCSRSSA